MVIEWEQTTQREAIDERGRWPRTKHEQCQDIFWWEEDEEPAVDIQREWLERWMGRQEMGYPHGYLWRVPPGGFLYL